MGSDIKDYEVAGLENLINKVLNPIQSKSEEIKMRYLRLHGSVYYFEYAVGAVQAQEWALASGQADALIVGSAVSAYMHMDSCLRLFDYALQGISNDQARLLRNQYKKWKDGIKHVRDRVAAHPEEDERRGVDKKFYIMSKRSGFCSDGRVWINQITIRAPYKSDQFILTPRKDLEKLRKYLTDFSVAVKGGF